MEEDVNELIRSILRWMLFLTGLIVVVSCGDDEPMGTIIEHEKEEITDVTLTFLRVSGGEVVTVRAQDPDGDGPGGMQILGEINLQSNASYLLNIELHNTLTGQFVNTEIIEEGGEHQIFFEFTEDLFLDPTGNGNTDSGSDPINYGDNDNAGLPIGLVTFWSPGNPITNARFRVALRHHSGIKPSPSNGSTIDMDLTFVMNVL